MTLEIVLIGFSLLFFLALDYSNLCRNSVLENFVPCRKNVFVINCREICNIFACYGVSSAFKVIPLNDR